MRAIFLDRDGVINENRVDHVKCWEEFRFLPGVMSAIARLTEAGLLIFIVTNQAIINRGMVPRQTVDEINHNMVREIERHGGRVEAVAYCPHRPDEGCGCRKPAPGLILDLMARYRLHPSECVVIGDALSDMHAGRAAGAATIMVRTGRGHEQLLLVGAAGRFNFTVVADLAAAAARLCQSAEALVAVPSGGGE